MRVLAPLGNTSMSAEWKPESAGAIRQFVARVKKQVGDAQRKGDIVRYTGGASSKFDEARFCLTQIHKIKKGQHGEVELQFYTDAFWWVSWTTLEMLGQVVNVTEQLGLQEHGVSFHKIWERITNSGRTTTSRLASRLDRIKNGTLRSWICGYRHCASHRRPVFVAISEPKLRVPASYADSTAPLEYSLAKTNRELLMCKHDTPIIVAPGSMVKLIPRCTKAAKQLDRTLSGVFRLLSK